MTRALDIVEKKLVIRAMRCVQGNHHVYAFFMPGKMITEISDISRIHRSHEGKLEGFQRKEIREHIRQIVSYLDGENVLFPNAIILAVNDDVEFKQARGREPEGVLEVGQIGTLIIPARSEGARPAWIVDGQQRAIALRESAKGDLPVPVIAFVAPELMVQREQFILVNKARPLPTRLINELLPEVDVSLPRDLASRKVPAELCRLLNSDARSPFKSRIRMPSDDAKDDAVISDTALIEVIRRSINEPLGALSIYRGLGNTQYDPEGMYRALLLYWKAVAEIFPKAWALPPTQSRLTHSAGIRAMGVLMDRLLERYISLPEPANALKSALKLIEPHCNWTEGRWDSLDMAWNDIQNNSRHIRLLTDQLLRIDAAVNLRIY